MGVMKRAVELVMFGGGQSTAFKVAFGFLPEPPPEPTKEERAAAREAAREAKAERAAIQAVEREQEEERRRAEEAARPRVFAPDPPDFPRSNRPARVAPPAADVELDPEHVGLAVEWPRTANIARADRERMARLRADAAAGREPPAEIDGEAPEPPEVPTGWYRLGDGYARIGSGPFPLYRPPGLTWKPYWLIPKPDDVPWDDDGPKADPPPAVAAAPEPPRETPGGKLKQGSLF